jgi:hypothetical protein
MVMQYLHDAVHEVEEVCFLINVFRAAGCLDIPFECFSVLFEPCGELASSLSDVVLITVGAG